MSANALDTKKSLQVFNLQGFISWGARTDSNRRYEFIRFLESSYTSLYFN